MSNRPVTSRGDEAPPVTAESSRDERESAEQREGYRQVARNRASRIDRLVARGMIFLMFGAAIVLFSASLLVDGVSTREGYGIPLALLGLLLCGAYVVHRNRRAGRAVARLAAELRGTWSVDRLEDMFDWLERHWRSRLSDQILIPQQTLDHRWCVQGTWQGYPVLVFWIRISESEIVIDKTVVFVARQAGRAGEGEARPPVEENDFTLAWCPPGVLSECEGEGVRALEWDRIRRVLDRSIAMIEGDRHA